MNADQLAKKLEEAGAVMTSAGAIAVDSRRLLQAFPDATLVLADATPGCTATLTLPIA